MKKLILFFYFLQYLNPSVEETRSRVISSSKNKIIVSSWVLIIKFDEFCEAVHYLFWLSGVLICNKPGIPLVLIVNEATRKNDDDKRKEIIIAHRLLDHRTSFVIEVWTFLSLVLVFFLCVYHWGFLWIDLAI